MSYDPNPRYPLVGGEVDHGFEALAAEVARERPGVLAIDGPATLPWGEFGPPLLDALRREGVAAELRDARAVLLPWDEIRRRTESAVLPGDPVFGRVFDGFLTDLVDGRASTPSSTAETAILLGPGSAFHEHDRLWYADLPKWLSLRRIQDGEAGNIGQPPGEPGSEQRLFFVDWPLLDRHKQGLLPRLDRRGLDAPHFPPRAGRRSVSRPADLPARPVGWSVAAKQARDLDRCAQPGLVLRADHP
jgi:hypothetical protein